MGASRLIDRLNIDSTLRELGNIYNSQHHPTTEEHRLLPTRLVANTALEYPPKLGIGAPSGFVKCIVPTILCAVMGRLLKLLLLCLLLFLLLLLIVLKALNTHSKDTAQPAS